jgi:hypothetical protein
MKTWLFKKRCFKLFKWQILGLLLVEALVIVGWRVYDPFREKAQLGYIVKNGQRYLVLWKTASREQQIDEFQDLKDAIRFAKSELELDCAEDRLGFYPIEYSWLKPNMGGFTFYWKVLNYPFFNRLTFKMEAEAKLFQSLVQKGAYSPSPIGHAIALFPLKKN